MTNRYDVTITRIKPEPIDLRPRPNVRTMSLEEAREKFPTTSKPENGLELLERLCNAVRVVTGPPEHGGERPRKRRAKEKK